MLATPTYEELQLELSRAKRDLAEARAKIGELEAHRCFDSLADERDRLDTFNNLAILGNRRQFTICSACYALINIAPRALNKGQIVWMSKVYKRMKTSSTPGQWVDQMDVTGRNRDYSYLERWGLIEAKPESDEEAALRGQKGGRSSFWRITEKGVQFLMKEIKVESHIFIFRKEFLGFPSGATMVGVEDIIKGFNWYDFMDVPRPGQE